MNLPEAWTDDYYVSKYRTIYANHELRIPGLRMFGKHTMNQACAPLAPHFHRNAYEFTFITEGTIHFTVNQKDYELSGYDIFITRPDEVHSTNLLPLSTGEIYWFQLDVSDPGHLLFLEEEAGNALNDGLSRLPHHAFRPGNSRLLQHVRKAFELARDFPHRYFAASCLLYALHEIMALSDDNRLVTPDIEKAAYYIKEHIRAELTLEELAGICGLSLSQFKQKFKSQTGISPRHYINYQKIHLSKRLLLEEKSITDIAMELGFCNSSYFTAVFRRFNACTPSEYQRQSIIRNKDHLLNQQATTADTD